MAPAQPRWWAYRAALAIFVTVFLAGALLAWPRAGVPAVPVPVPPVAALAWPPAEGVPPVDVYPLAGCGESVESSALDSLQLPAEIDASMPTSICIGAQKSGTTTLNWLMESWPGRMKVRAAPRPHSCASVRPRPPRRHRDRSLNRGVPQGRPASPRLTACATSLRIAPAQACHIGAEAHFWDRTRWQLKKRSGKTQPFAIRGLIQAAVDAACTGGMCVQNGVYNSSSVDPVVYTREALAALRKVGARVPARSNAHMQHPVPCTLRPIAGVCGTPVDADYAVTCERAVRRRISRLQWWHRRPERRSARALREDPHRYVRFCTVPLACSLRARSLR